MKKIVTIITIVGCCILGIAVFGYIFVRKTTSDEAIKSRLLGTLKNFGKVEIGRAHVDFSEGIIIDNLSFIGAYRDLQGKSLKIPKVILKLNLQSLIKGQLNISNAVIIAPELTIEKPTDIWSLLDAVKANFNAIEMPMYVDVLRHGAEIRDLKIHIKEDPQTKSPEINLSGVNITFLPYAGAFKDVIINGNVEDALLGNYSFTMDLHPDIPSLNIEVHTNNLVLSEAFLTRFPYIGNMVWDNYKPTGKVSALCKAGFNNRDGQKKMDYTININLNGLKAMYGEWPFLIYNLNGEVELNTEKLYLKGIVGYIKSGDYTSQVEFKGEFDLQDSKETFVMAVPNLFINQELLKNIPKVGEQVWSKMRPTGVVDLSFQHSEGEKQRSSCFVVVDCKGLEITPLDFPLPISYVNGQFKLCNNIILFKNASGFIQCGDQSVFTEMNGVYDMNSGRKIFSFHAPNLSITESFLKNLPNKTIGEKLSKNLNPTGKVDISANFQGFSEEKDNDYSVEINLKDCEIMPSTYKVPLYGMEGRLEFNKRGFFSKHIDAKCCGGHVEGALSVETNVDPYQYKGDLSFSRIELEELVQKVTKEENSWSGLLSGSIKFQGSGTDPKNFCAEGQINVNEGYLSDVPIILSVFNLLNLGVPKKDSFRNAQINFTVEDGIIHINKGRLYSDAVELVGRGDIHLSGKLHIDVVAGFSKDFFSQLPLVGKLFDFVVGGVRRQLTMVEIKGTFSNPESHSVPFRPLTRSIRSMFDLLPKNGHEMSTNIEATGEKEPPR